VSDDDIRYFAAKVQRMKDKRDFDRACEQLRMLLVARKEGGVK